MASKKSSAIYVDVEFIPQIQSFLEQVKDELGSAELERYIGLDKAVKEQVRKVKATLAGLRDEVRSAIDGESVRDNTKEFDNLAKRLDAISKDMDKLKDSISDNKIKNSLASSSKQAAEFGKEVKAVGDSLQDIKSFYSDNKKLSVVDAREIDALKQVKKVLYTDYKDKSITGNLNKDLITLRTSITKINDMVASMDLSRFEEPDYAIINPQEAIEATKLLDLIERLGAAYDNFATKHGEEALDVPFDNYSTYSESLSDLLDRGNDLTDKLEPYQRYLENIYQNSITFIRDIATQDKKIEVPLAIKDNEPELYDQTMSIIEKLRAHLDETNQTIPIKISIISEYTNNKLKSEVLKLQDQVSKVKGGKELQAGVQSLLDKINDKFALDFRFDEKKSGEAARKFIDQFKKDIGKDLTIVPKIEIPKEEIDSKAAELQTQLDAITSKLTIDLGKANFIVDENAVPKVTKDEDITPKKGKGKKKEVSTVSQEVVDITKITEELRRLKSSVPSDILKGLKFSEKDLKNIQELIPLINGLSSTGLSEGQQSQLKQLANDIFYLSTALQGVESNIVPQAEAYSEAISDLGAPIPEAFTKGCESLANGLTKLNKALNGIDENFIKKINSIKSLGNIKGEGIAKLDLATFTANLNSIKELSAAIDDDVLSRLAKVQTLPELLTFKIPEDFIENIVILNAGLEKFKTTCDKFIKKVVPGVSEIVDSDFIDKFAKFKKTIDSLINSTKSFGKFSFDVPENFAEDIDELGTALAQISEVFNSLNGDLVNQLKILDTITKVKVNDSAFENYEDLRVALNALKDAVKVVDKNYLKKLEDIKEVSNFLKISVPKDFPEQMTRIGEGVKNLKESLDKMNDNFFKQLDKLKESSLTDGVKVLKDFSKSFDIKIPEDFEERCQEVSAAIETLKNTFEQVDVSFIENLSRFTQILGEFKKTFDSKLIQKILSAFKKTSPPAKVNELLGLDEADIEEEATEVGLEYFTALRNSYKKAMKGDAIDLLNFKELLEQAPTGTEDIPEELNVYRNALLEAIKVQEQFDKIIRNPNISQEYKATIEQMRGEINLLSEDVEEAFNTGDFDGMSKILETIKKLNDEIKQASIDSRLPENKLVSDSAINSTISRLDKLGKFTAMSREYRAELDAIRADLTSGKPYTTKELDAVNRRIIEIEKNLIKSGKNTKSVLDKLSMTISDQAIRFAAQVVSFQRFIQYIRQGWEYALQFDTALTKISYTMDLTDAQLNSMGEDILSLSQKLKTSISDMATIYQIYSNMNTSAKEMSILAESTAVLSNLTGVDAGTAADQIQSVVQQFENLESVDASHIIDVFDYISSNIAVDYSKGIQGIADAVKNVGNVADKAGISFEQLSAIIATVMEQTRAEGSSIANGLKTILVRISKASTMSDEVDNETLSNASKALHAIGVEVYNNNGEYREFGTIMSELAAKWDNLTDAQQANISYATAATRQTAVFKAILQNWNRSSKIAQEAMQTEGNAVENQEKYLESLAGKLQGVKNELQDFWITFLNTDAVDVILDSLQKLLEILNKFQKTFGGAGTIGITLTSLLGLKEFTRVYNSGGQSSGIFQDLFDKIVNGIKKTTEARKKATIALKQETLAEKKETVASTKNALANEGQAASQRDVANSANQAKNGTNGAMLSDKAEEASSKSNTLANEEQALSQNALAASGKALASSTAIGLLITVAITAISKLSEFFKKQETILKDSFEQFKSTITDYNEELDSILSRKGEITDLAKKYEKLSVGVDRFGKNISLSQDDFNEYRETVNEIKNLFPELASGYTDTGDAIIYMANAYDTLSKKQSEALENQYYEIIRNKDTLDTWKYAYNKRPFTFVSDIINQSERINLIKDIINKLNNIEDTDSYEILQNELDSMYVGAGLEDYGIERIGTGGLINTEKKAKEAVEKYKRTQLSLLYAAINSIESEIEEKLSGVRTLAEAYLKIDSDYKSLEDENKAVLDEIIRNISADTAKNWTKNSEVSEYVSSIIKEFKDSSPELKGALSNALTLDVADLDPVSAYEVVSVYLEDIFKFLEEEYADDPEKIKEKKELWSKILGFDLIEEDYKRIENLNKRLAYVYRGASYKEITEFYNSLSSENKKFWEEFFSVSNNLAHGINPIESFTEALNIERSKQSWSDFVSENEKLKESVENYLKSEKSLGDYLSKIKSGSYTTDDVLTLQLEWDIDTTDASTMISEIQRKMNELQNEILSGDINEILNDEYASVEVKNHISALTEEIKRANAEAQGLKYTLRQSLDVVGDVENLEGAFQTLDAVMADVVDKGDFDYSSIINNDGFKELFGSLASYDDFINEVTHHTDDIEATQEAFNQLITEYVYGANVLESINEEQSEVIKNMFEQWGVTNALEVVESALNDTRLYEAKIIEDVNNANAVLSDAKKDLALDTETLDQYTWQEINALIQEAETCGYTAQHLAIFALQKAAAEGIDLTNENDINYLLSLASAAGIAIRALTALSNVKAQIAETESTISSISEKMKKGTATTTDINNFINAQTKLKNLNESLAYYESNPTSVLDSIKEEILNFKTVEINPVKLNWRGGEKTKTAIDGLNSAASDTKEKVEEVEEKVEEAEVDYEGILDKAIDYLKKQFDAQQIALEKYLNDRLALIQDYYDRGLISAEKYYSALSEYYSDQLTIYDSIISAINRVIDEEIENLEDQKKATEDSYKAKKDAIQEEIDALEKANEARQDSIDLQKAEYELARSQNQRTRLIYKNGQMVYANDPRAVREARENKATKEYELSIKSLKEQIEALEEEMNNLTDDIDKQIDALNEYKNEWNSIADAYENAQQSALAYQYFGDGWKEAILSQNEDILQSYKDMYSGIEQAMRDAAASSAFEAWQNAEAEAAETLANANGSSSNSEANPTGTNGSGTGTNSTTDDLIDTLEDLIDEEEKVEKALGNHYSSDKSVDITIGIKGTASPKLNTNKHLLLNYKGTAYDEGNWTAGSKGTSGDSLVGELGPELRVSNGKYEILGANGAELTKVKKNDIIFNHKQTEALLKNGRINSRGKAFAEGKFSPLTNLSSDKLEQYRALSTIASNIPKLAQGVENIIKVISAPKFAPATSPVINIENTSFTCTGVTGEQVMRQIESNFKGLVLNAYQQVMK